MRLSRVSITAALMLATIPTPELWAQRPGTAAPDTARNSPFVSLTEAALGGVFVLSLVGPDALEGLDADLSSALAREAQDRDKWPRWGGRELGSGTFSLATAAVPLAYGVAFGDGEARQLGLHSLESLYASALVVRLLKNGVGRARPEVTSEPDVFVPFNSDAAFHSFPSGHTARVFALATVYSRHLGREAPWVPWLAYSLAAWTATTRVMDGSHWITDVTAGAAVGIVTTRLVEWLGHRAANGSPVSVALMALPDERLGVGVRIGLR